MDQVSRILKAETFFQRLDLPNQKTELSVIKKAYRKLALVVHPDKCKIPGSDEAFKLLTEAFENLSSYEKQETYLAQVDSKKERDLRKKRREEDLEEYLAKKRKTSQPTEPKNHQKEEPNKKEESNEEIPSEKESPPKKTSKGFQYTYSNQETQNTQKTNPTQSLSCTICKRSFPNKKALMRHLMFSDLNHKFPRGTKKKEKESESIFPDVS